MNADVPDRRLFHGGVAGLGPGDRITPGFVHRKLHDRCATCEAHARGENGPLEPATPTGRVYATTDRQYARYYASKVGLGWLYVVRPDGDLYPADEGDLAPTWWAEAFEVVSVYERAVRLTPRERRRLFIRWGGSDTEWQAVLASVGLGRP